VVSSNIVLNRDPPPQVDPPNRGLRVSDLQSLKLASWLCCGLGLLTAYGG